MTTPASMAAQLLAQIKADPARRKPTYCTNDNRRALIAALEAARKAVCGYAGPTCDCKYGLVPGGAEPYGLGSEETGCPEIRDLIRLVNAELIVSEGETR